MLLAMLDTTSTPEVEELRAFAFADFAVRIVAPLALDAAGLKNEAAKLRALPEIMDRETARAAAAAAEAAAEAAAAAAAEINGLSQALVLRLCAMGQEETSR